MQARLMLHPTAFKCRNTTNLFANAHANKGSADEKSIRGRVPSPANSTKSGASFWSPLKNSLFELSLMAMDFAICSTSRECVIRFLKKSPGPELA
jgi:hypothetical protein